MAAGSLLGGVALAQSPVTLTVDSQALGAAIPTNFIGVSFGPSALKAHVFDGTNSQVLTLFQQCGVKYFRMGGTWVDTNSAGYMPSIADIDSFFGFIQAAGLRDVIYTLRLENGDPAQDAVTASHIWTNYNASLTCFAIGNEPDLYHGDDPTITNTSSYVARWNTFAAAITNAVPDAIFGGPDSGGGGAAYAAAFAAAEKTSGNVAWILSHYYVGGSSSGLTAQQMNDNMLSAAWDTTKYPSYYNKIGALALTNGFAYRLTEVNSYSGGNVAGGSDGFGSALFALDFMYWWAGHGCSGVGVHTGLSNLNGLIYQDANGNWQPFPWAYALKAFDLGSHGNLAPIAITNPNGLNLTAYAAGDTTTLWVTIINKEHGTGAQDANVTMVANGMTNGSVAAMFLTAPGGDVTVTNGITLGGAAITNQGPWLGQWTTLGSLTNGQCTVTVPAASAAVVRILLPTNLMFSLAGNQLTLAWPADHIGWRLLAQTNNLAESGSWFEVAASRNTNRVIVPVGPTNNSVFYRLVYP